MEFKNILAEHKCDCLDKAKEDYTSHFAIKTNTENLRVQDFQSYWEKGKIPSDNKICEDVCSFKGVSISIFNNITQDEVINIYKELFPLAPKYKLIFPHFSRH